MGHGDKNSEPIDTYLDAPLPKFLDEDATTVARKLLGCFIIREFAHGEKAVLKIVETESYDQFDEASHTFGGRTARNASMFGPSGHWYVYFTYGMHYCCNVVAGQDGIGAGALIRAAEPVFGTELIELYRGKTGVHATNGPAKICQALQITRQFDGHDAGELPFRLAQGEPVADRDVTVTTRIGISRAASELRRFYITDNPYVSVKAASAGRT